MIDDYSYPLHSNGTITTLPAPDETEAEERVRRLRESVMEITGQDLPEPMRNPIGFVW